MREPLGLQCICGSETKVIESRPIARGVDVARLAFILKSRF